MDQCYINLTIVEQPGQPGRSKVSSPFSLPARLKVEDLGEEHLQIELPSLFHPRESGHVQTNPRRILIRGRPGVGKTTLCKKIVFEFTNGAWTSWSKLFDRVLWVPLRRLKRIERLQQPGYNFFHFLSHEYFFPKGAEGLALALSDALDTTKSSRTLFLLDGLDEVSQDIGNESDMFRFLEELLNQPNVIITSRPSGKLPSGLTAIDIELETIGFYPNQVIEYLERVLPEQANEVQSFLRDHSLIQDLVRVPIQLDALCFTWNHGFPGKFDTMTTIYRALEDGLWKKDILRLNKTHAGQPVTEALLQYSGSSEFRVLVKDEIHFLEGFAFAGIHNDVIDFEPRHQSAISQHLDPLTTIFLAKTLPCLSFLRTSDPSTEKHSRSYHFLHLTYQEYFAARYFVRQWQVGGSLTCPIFTTGECQETGTRDFLRKHKYTARFDVFWRFVSGLLDSDGMGEQFFTAIEDKPRDLLGPTHQRLVMHCLSEASAEMPLRKSLEKRLKEWLLFEGRFAKWARLASEVEFPEGPLLDALQEEPSLRGPIIRGLAGRPTLTSRVADLMCAWLEGDEDASFKEEALMSLQLQRAGRRLPDHLLTAMVSLALRNTEDWIVRRHALSICGGQADLSDEHLEAILALVCCKDEDRSIRQSAMDALVRSNQASNHVDTLVATLLNDKDRFVKRAALKILEAQPSLSDNHFEVVLALACCKDADRNIRRLAWNVLSTHPNLSNENAEATAALVLCGNENYTVRRAALKALTAQRSLSKERLEAIFIALLEDEEPRSSLCDVIEDGSDGRSEDGCEDGSESGSESGSECGSEDWMEEDSMRREVLNNLRIQPSLSSERLETVVVACLGDWDWRTRQFALRALEALPSHLSEERFGLVLGCLQDSDEHVRNAAFQVLAAQSNLHDHPMVAATSHRENETEAEAGTLEGFEALPGISDDSLRLMVVYLQDSEEGVRNVALGVLETHPGLPDDCLAAVVALLEHEDRSLRVAALRVLRAQPSLSDECLNVVVALFEDDFPFVRFATLNVLEAQPSVSDARLETGVVALLKNEDYKVKRAALEFLGARPSLLDGRLTLWTAVAALLESENHEFEDLKNDPEFIDYDAQADNAFIGSTALAMLRGDPDVCSSLLSGPSAGLLLNAFLRCSFGEQCSWYVEDGVLWVNDPDRIRNAKIDDMQLFKDMVMKSRPPGIPLGEASQEEEIW